MLNISDGAQGRTLYYQKRTLGTEAQNSDQLGLKSDGLHKTLLEMSRLTPALHQLSCLEKVCRGCGF